jgi:uncharacterized protein YciI
VIFAFHLIDRPDAGDLRQRVRPEHKAYLAAVADRIAFAGPLTEDDGQTMIGSLLVIDFEGPRRRHALGGRRAFHQGGPVPDVSVLPFTNLWPQKAGFPPA